VSHWCVVRCVRRLRRAIGRSVGQGHGRANNVVSSQVPRQNGWRQMTRILSGFGSLNSLRSCHPPSLAPPSVAPTVAMSHPPQHSTSDPCSDPAPSGRRDGAHRGSGDEGVDASSALGRDRGDEPLLSLDEALRLHHEASHASQPSGLAGTLASSGLRSLGPLPSLVPSRELGASQVSENERRAGPGSLRDDARRSVVTAGEILDEACRVAEEVDEALRRARRQGGRSPPGNPNDLNQPAPRRREGYQ
jgi:hypothetical protein